MCILQGFHHTVYSFNILAPGSVSCGFYEQSGVVRAGAGSDSVCTWLSEHREMGAGSLELPGASLSASRSGSLCPGTVVPC